MKRTLCIVCTVACALSAFAQTQIDLSTQTKNVNFSGAASTRPVKSGPTLPGSCNIGELFFLTSGQPGANVYGCAPANTWAAEGTGAAGVAGATGATGPAGPAGAIGPVGTNGAISAIENNGTTQTVRPNLNLISGANATVVCADNSGASRTDCTLSSTGGAVTVESNGTAIGSPRTTINFIATQGIAHTITDTGSAINVSEGTDSAVIPTKSSLQSAAATTITVTSTNPTAYVGSLAPILTTYTGAILTWTPGTSCTPGAITININGLGAVPVVEANGTTNPVAADCAAANIDTIAYDGARFRIIAGGAGVSGSTGATGPAGPAGATGPTGTSGTNGTNGAISAIENNGTTQTVRPNLNLISGTNATVVCADNSGASRTDCTISATGSGGGAITVESNGTPIGSPRTTINFISSQGIANAITDTGSAINVSEGTDSAVIPTKSSLQTGAAQRITITSSSATTYTGTVTPTLSTYTGAILLFVPGTSCTAGAITINITGPTGPLGVVPVTRADGLTNPIAGDCTATNIDTIAYDGSVFRIISGGITTGATGAAGAAGATGPAGSAGTNGAISAIENNGTTQTVRPNLNLIGGSNVTVTCADNAGASRADCTFAASSAAPVHGLMFSIGSPGGTPLTTASVSSVLTVPFSCAIGAWNLAYSAGDSGTITVKFAKVATGTAIPSNANFINTNGVGISTGTAIHSATVTDFTTLAVSANDLIAMFVTAVSGPASVTGVLQCQ
jgi:hypothetical protein